MKSVISTPRFVLIFSCYVILLAHVSAEMPGGLKNATISRGQRYREARRLAGTTQHSPSKGLARPDDIIEYFTLEWAGAWQTNIPDSPQGPGTFNAVTAKWRIPAVQLPPNPGSPGKVWEVSAFIGLDGNSLSCPALFQAGTTTYAKLDANGVLQTDVTAFAEWYPTPEIELNSLDLKVGDTVQVRLQLDAGSFSSGKAYITNIRNGLSLTQAVSAPTANDHICGKSADWIVENSPLADGSRAPLVQFFPYIFEGCVAATTNGETTDLTNAAEVIMVDTDNQNAILANPTIVDKNTLQVTYGPGP